jgi:hypothetical protein
VTKLYRLLAKALIPPPIGREMTNEVRPASLERQLYSRLRWSERKGIDVPEAIAA